MKLEFAELQKVIERQQAVIKKFKAEKICWGKNVCDL